MNTPAVRLIVIGGSLGGLDAFCQIVRVLPYDFAGTIAFVLHTPSDGPRLLPEIIGRFTSLPTSYAVDGQEIRAGHIYCAPPAFHLTVKSPGNFALDDGPKVNHVRPSANRLFETAAHVYGSDLIGVIVTGGDGDGADGFRAIDASNGLRIVQAPADARDPGMPLSALERDHPNYCVPLAEIGPLLISLIDAPSQAPHIK
ncbi:chemotaxis protein CheB [Burkholderia sp. PAMC 26561]|uniref:chemotaxis protein CheB n=1 Tax=Burkholderia sp. PAMC 26561 TaxID=1795043 RepID=UPI0007803BE2